MAKCFTSKGLRVVRTVRSWGQEVGKEKGCDFSCKRNLSSAIEMLNKILDEDYTTCSGTLQEFSVAYEAINKESQKILRKRKK